MRTKQRWAWMLALLLLLAGCRRAPAPPPAPSQPPPAKVLAFFGDGWDPWCCQMEEAAVAWAEGRQWRCLRYDCRGDEARQQLQVDDLLRREEADLAVIVAAGGQETLARCTQALEDAGIPTLCASKESGVADAEMGAGQLCVSHAALTAGAADFCKGLLTGEDQGVILLADVLDDPRIDPLRTALETAGVPVLEQAYTWGGVDIARDYIAEVMDRFPQARAIICFSRCGTLGAGQAVGQAGRRGQVHILSLMCSRELLAELEGEMLDSVVAPPAEEAAGLLSQALDQAAAGQRPGRMDLPVAVLTPGP